MQMKPLKAPFNKVRFVAHLTLVVVFAFMCDQLSSRVFLSLTTILFEAAVLLSNRVRRAVNNKPVPFHLLSLGVQLVFAFLFEKVLVAPPLELPGLKPPRRGFPGGPSGENRVLVGASGAIAFPYSADVGSVISAGARSAMGTPYVTGKDVSVVIVARDEDPYLSKTIMYTYEMTPASMLKEFVIVDDMSENLQSDILDKELPANVRRLVRVIRFDSKEGLIRARIVGADAAQASNIFFLDGHCRPKAKWLEPLIKHLQTNYRRLACPIIYDIRRDTWEDAGTSGSKMMFDWTFEFGWYDDLTDEVPLSAGGIFAMTKRWWEESGKYDPGMLEWGGENIEQSLRVWQCGGEIYVVRDSIVGHIFDRPAKPNPGGSLVRQVQTNQKRAALVWMDKYHYTNMFITAHRVIPSLDEGANLEERHALRHQLRCQSFQWYINKFRTSFERKGLLLDHYHHIQHVRSRWCLTLAPADPSETDPYLKGGRLVLEQCVANAASQMWQTVAGNRMMYGKQTVLTCLDRHHAVASPGVDLSANRPRMYTCQWNNVFRGTAYNQFFQFDVKTGRVFTYVTDDFKTITGNDIMPIASSKSVDGDSLCLTNSLTFWNADSISIGGDFNKKHGINHADVYLDKCGAKSVGDTWEDAQAWKWLW